MEEWEKNIRGAWDYNPECMKFHAAIWESSTEILKGLEVQVVIDSKDRLHISSGSPGYVSFSVDPVGMSLPVKCWIHTHPFGQAYWSSVDWHTIDTWRPLMKQAIVLGFNQFGIWEQGNGYNWLHVTKQLDSFRTTLYEDDEE